MLGNHFGLYWFRAEIDVVAEVASGSRETPTDGTEHDAGEIAERGRQERYTRGDVLRAELGRMPP